MSPRSELNNNQRHAPAPCFSILRWSGHKPRFLYPNIDRPGRTHAEPRHRGGPPEVERAGNDPPARVLVATVRHRPATHAAAHLPALPAKQSNY